MAASKSQSFRHIFLSSTLFFFLALALTAYSAKNPEFASGRAAFASSTLRPFQSFHRYIRWSVLGVWEKYINLIATESENRRLHAQLAVLRAKNSRLMELKHENDRLRDMLHVKNEVPHKQIVANVIAYEPSNWSHAITIDRGTDEGIEINNPVVVGDGVVGQVVAVNRNTARVLLLTDPSSGVDAYVQASRVRGVVMGMGKFRARWSYVLSKENVRIGDRVITSGLDGVYPKGLIIGVIRYLREDRSGRLFKRVDVEPAVDFNRLETVSVIVNYQGDDVVDFEELEKQAALEQAAKEKAEKEKLENPEQSQAANNVALQPQAVPSIAAQPTNEQEPVRE